MQYEYSNFVIFSHCSLEIFQLLYSSSKERNSKASKIKNADTKNILWILLPIKTINDSQEWFFVLHIDSGNA